MFKSGMKFEGSASILIEWNLALHETLKICTRFLSHTNISLIWETNKNFIYTNSVSEQLSVLCRLYQYLQ